LSWGCAHLTSFSRLLFVIKQESGIRQTNRQTHIKLPLRTPALGLALRWFFTFVAPTLVVTVCLPTSSLLPVSHLWHLLSSLASKYAFESSSQPQFSVSIRSCLMSATMQVHVSIRLVSHYGVLAAWPACHWPFVLAAMVQATHSPFEAHLTRSTRNTTLNLSLRYRPDCRDMSDGSTREQSVCALREFRREHASHEQPCS
jgi:hypothetical protein